MPSARRDYSAPHHPAVAPSADRPTVVLYQSVSPHLATFCQINSRKTFPSCGFVSVPSESFCGRLVVTFQLPLLIEPCKSSSPQLYCLQDPQLIGTLVELWALFPGIFNFSVVSSANFWILPDFPEKCVTPRLLCRVPRPIDSLFLIEYAVHQEGSGSRG